MSRYPFDEFSNKYLEVMTGVYAPVTLQHTRRRLRRMGLDIRQHHADGRISTTSPKLMTVEDVRVHLVYRRSLGYSAKEYSHELTAMTGLFDFVGNGAVRACLKKYPQLKPTSPRRSRLPVNTSDDCRRMIETMDDAADHGDPQDVRACAMMALFLGCGCRTKELAAIEEQDLDLGAGTLDIIHVKGEDSYGEARTVPVPPWALGILETYLQIKPRTIILFPSPMDQPLSGNSIRRILDHALRMADVDSEPRMLRRTFGQNYLDMGIDSIESVSILMGHASTRTTEKYYARRRNASAIEAARAVWRGCGAHTSNTPSEDHAEGTENPSGGLEHKLDSAGDGHHNPDGQSDLSAHNPHSPIEDSMETTITRHKICNGPYANSSRFNSSGGNVCVCVCSHMIGRDMTVSWGVAL